MDVTLSSGLTALGAAEYFGEAALVCNHTSQVTPHPRQRILPQTPKHYKNL